MMTIHPTQERLNDYVDGDLVPAQRRELEEHLERCEACRSEVESIRRLVQTVATLAVEMVPPPEIWAGVRADTLELGPRRRAALWGMRHGLAAAAVVLIALSSALTMMVSRPRTSNAPPARAPIAVVESAPSGAAAPARPIPAALVAFREAEAGYLRTAADLEAVLKTREEHLSPETVRIVEENLRLIDGAIRDASAALEADPGSAELPILLSSMYHDKIAVLERVVRVSQS